MNKYYEVKIRLQIEDGDRLKFINQTYLISAIAVTEAEQKTHKDFEGYHMDWEIKSIRETSIEKVIE